MAKRRRKSDARIYLCDQCPSIGCGERGVQIVSQGWKWVRFRETATGTPGKLSLRDWGKALRKD